MLCIHTHTNEIFKYYKNDSAKIKASRKGSLYLIFVEKKKKTRGKKASKSLVLQEMACSVQMQKNHVSRGKKKNPDLALLGIKCELIANAESPPVAPLPQAQQQGE